MYQQDVTLEPDFIHAIISRLRVYFGCSAAILHSTDIDNRHIIPQNDPRRGRRDRKAVQ